eukprot:gene28014-31111_t
MAVQEDFKPFTGTTLLLAGVVLALTNFMVVLDTTIANVSVAHISGSLGISSTQGTWVITSYAVAEAICVPLTGWLAGRFGTVKTFIFGMLGFGLFSMLCGSSNSLTMLVACRIGQGLCGGPLMPLSQTLLLRIFPKEQQGQAMGLWAMTTVTAPILGPILGGTISDSWSWHWIFFINIPIAALCAFGAHRLLSSAETGTEKLAMDKIGLALLVIWIGALQIMLDIGREHDWFGDTLIVILAIVAAIGESHSAGIPVVLSNGRVDKSGEAFVAAWTGPDHHKTGYLSGQLLVEALGEKANIVIISGTPGTESGDRREKGCRDALAEHPGVTLLDAQPANFKREKAQSIMEAYITRFGDKIDGVCANDDDMALGALTAVKAAVQAGRLKPDHIKITAGA